MGDVLRWGILATGLIANDFATALGNKPQSHVITAVGGRSQQKVDDFAAKFNIKNKFYSVEQLARCTNVDVVYVASLTSLHYEHCKLLLEADKHVLCEKPLALMAEQTRELLQLAKSRNKFLMFGMWSRFLPSYQRLRSLIDSGKIGTVRAVNATFCFPRINCGAWLNDVNIGGGILGDFGVYLVHLACWVFKSERPKSITIVGPKVGEDGADRSGVVTLQYDNNCMAALQYSCDCGPLARAHIIGEKGVIELSEVFWCTTKLKVNSEEEVVFDSPPGEYNYPNCGSLIYQADHVKDCLKRGLNESQVLPHSDCQLIHDILGEGYRQLGVQYGEMS